MLPFLNKYTVLFLRILFVYLAYGFSRVLFYFYNESSLENIFHDDPIRLLKGALLFDTVSVIYTNSFFILLSLLFFQNEPNWLKKIKFWSYIIPNAFGFFISIADVFYYPFKQSRIVMSDFAVLENENVFAILPDLITDYWYGILLYFLLLCSLFIGFKKTDQAFEIKKRGRFYKFFSFSFSLLIITAMVFLARGASFSAATYPVSMNDVFLYTEDASNSSLILSNPFCFFRTLNKTEALTNLNYFDYKYASAIYPTTHKANRNPSVKIPPRTNVFLIILESFGSAFIKGSSDQFSEKQESYTPFLDSLMTESYVFKNTFQNGRRSIDALPSILASIPSFKDHFLSFPNSVGSYKALPSCLSEMDYKTVFFHGSVKESMGFVAFGKASGINHFYTREDYEKKNGNKDFDGKWGIWDHKFLPYVHQKVNEIQGKQPFFATLFTLSSHHPYLLPLEMQGKFKEGTMPIHRTIAYSDSALKEFFKQISKEDWFKNTLFVITADHSSGADNKKYSTQPYQYSVPLLFYKADDRLKGSDELVMQHIDIMPTLLGMLGYKKEYFSFGRDHFSGDSSKKFSLNYAGGLYNCTTDKYCFFFDEKKIIKKVAYKEDSLGKEPLAVEQGEDLMFLISLKAFLQQYSIHLKNRNYLPSKGPL